MKYDKESTWEYNLLMNVRWDSKDVEDVKDDVINFIKDFNDEINADDVFSFISNRMAIDRLKAEYLKHGRLIIGLDFDNTIFDLHLRGLDHKPVIDLLKRCNDLGFPMCLHTIIPLDDDNTRFKVKYCEDHGININHINSSPILTEQAQNYKPFYSILLDDRAGLGSAYNVLLTTLNELGI